VLFVNANWPSPMPSLSQPGRRGSGTARSARRSVDRSRSSRSGGTSWSRTAGATGAGATSRRPTRLAGADQKNRGSSPRPRSRGACPSSRSTDGCVVSAIESIGESTPLASLRMRSTRIASPAGSPSCR